MKNRAENLENMCPREEIFAYLDRELTAEEEFDLECHLTSCKTCTDEVNAQKKVSNSLEIILEEEMKNIKLPENFSRIVAAKAESSVGGIRQRKEIVRALVICGVLLLFLFIGFGSKVSPLIPEFQHVTSKIGSFVGFGFYLGYEALVGIGVILRSLTHKLVFGSVVSLITVAALFAVAFISLSRLVSRYSRL
ncbi:MAG: zf-HC2 domain-containing protein [Pyrinomonadaceae bacterium]